MGHNQFSRFFLTIIMQIKRVANTVIKNFQSIIFTYRKNINKKQDNKDLQSNIYINEIFLFIKNII